jgi:hypothetical protein
MGHGRASGCPTQRRSVARACILLALCGAPALVALVGGVAFAQQARPASAAPKVRAATRPAAPAKKPGQPVDAAPSASPGATLTPPSPAPPPGGYTASDAGVSEYKTLDGGTRVFKFTELDIEGRLKSPQLVYFLRRVRAEFAAGDLGHRSFMREMSETRKESSF